MKYRLVELLKCPEHPDKMLRVISASVSEVFPYAGEVRMPYCRAGCGLMGNWFEDFSSEIPHSNMLNCRKCLGSEIETGTLVCSVCGREFKIIDGLPVFFAGESDSFTEKQIPLAVAKTIERLLNLRPGELVLILSLLPDSITDKWGCAGIEKLQIHSSEGKMAEKRARSCANEHVLTNYMVGPVVNNFLRPDRFDAVIFPFSEKAFSESPNALETILSLLRPSGRAVMLIPGDSPPHFAEKLVKQAENLPGLPESYKTRLVRSSGMELLFFSPRVPVVV